jgi:hypothetical protein
MLPFAFAMAQLGQNLFAPPNVKGWPGGEAWINTTTLLARKQLLERLFRDEDMRAMSGTVEQASLTRVVTMDNARRRAARAMADVHFDASGWFAQLAGRNPEAVQSLLLPAAPASAVPADLHGMELLRVLTQDAVYQLK